jgi:hypothetical protein
VDGGYSLSESCLLYVGTTKAKEQRDNWTDEEKKKYIKFDAVMNSVGRLADITKADAFFLVGKKSGYDDLHTSHHTMDVQVVAIHIERLVKTSPSENRRRAIAKAFTFLTGYQSYADAYNNPCERREFTPKGIVNPNNTIFSLDEDDDDDKKNESVLLNLKF